MIEHTDRIALDDLYAMPHETLPHRAWYRVVWLWLKEHIFAEPLESRTDEDAVTRRIRVHEWATQGARRLRVHERATRGARRLRRLDREEQREVLAVMAMLLGLEKGKK